MFQLNRGNFNSSQGIIPIIGRKYFANDNAIGYLLLNLVILDVELS